MQQKSRSKRMGEFFLKNAHNFFGDKNKTITFAFPLRENVLRNILVW